VTEPGGLPLAAMNRRWGLQAKMTASYVAVTALAVLAVEAVVIGVAAPRVLSVQDIQTRVQATAASLATKLSARSAAPGRMRQATLALAGKPVAGHAEPNPNGGVVIPQIRTASCDLGPASFAVLVSPAGTVLATSYPACFAVGSHRPAFPAVALRSFRRPATANGTASVGSNQVVWAIQPVVQGAAAKPPAGAAAGTAKPFRGTLYVQAPANAQGLGGINPSLARTGLLLLALTVLLGIAFGLLSTRRLTKRITRLAASTLEVADGAFGRRIPVSGRDEVSQLEANFNRMAERLSAALAAERQLAGANARHEERSRIARELHDSISQDLFSLSMLAGGLRKALPANSAVRSEVESMERTAGATMREMQALLLELRPVALDEAGLGGALEGLCSAYRERLGIEITTDLEHLILPATLEHTLLRVAQESLANAVKHADAKLIRLSLRVGDGHLTLEVADDGRGFDPAKRGGTVGLGLRAMRERVAEQGGQFSLQTGPGQGTTIRATFGWEER
jgi:signal transduction histidine kinase